MALVLKNEEIERLLSMEQAITAVEAAFAELGRGGAVNLPRLRVRIPESQPGKSYFFNNLSGAVPCFQAAAVRLDSSFYRDVQVDGKQRREYPGDFVGIVLLFSMETCELLAILDDHFLSTLRVGATSGVGTRYLARPEAKVAGIIGSGEQARTQLEAVCAVRPIERIKVFSLNPDHRARFAAEMSRRLARPVIPEDSAEKVVRGSDVVIAATNSSEPVFAGKDLEPGAHVNSIVGGDIYNRRMELDDEAVRRSALIVVNSREQIRLDRQADLYDRLESGLIDPGKLFELGELLNGRAPGRKSAEEITLFKNNTGMGIQFAAVAAAAYAAAREKGAGRDLPAELFTTYRGGQSYSP